MKPKAVKITDVTGSGKVAPAASSRPLIVTNRPVIADPMVIPAAKAEDAATSETVNRTVKVIKPMTLTSREKVEDEDSKATEVEDEPEKNTDQEAVDTPPEPTASSNPISLDVEPAVTTKPEPRDADAEAEKVQTQLAEAAAARQQELDDLAASGKYFVPIGAVQRRKSHMYVVVLCIVGLLLALLLLDVVLDAGIIKVSKHIPHTHFFTTN